MACGGYDDTRRTEGSPMPKLLAPLGAVLATALAFLATPADAVHHPDAATASGTTRAGSTDGNPFATHPWGVYQGKMEPSWVAWNDATGTAKDHLAYIANKAKDHWFGHWNPNDKIAAQVRDYIANSQDGDKNALVQMAIFRVVPWEHDACNRLPTAGERSSYRQWIDRFAGAVGDTPTAIVLQPDGPFALCAPGGSHVPSKLVAYASRVLSAQPHTSVYIEAGASDWPMFGPKGGVTAAVRILVRGGIQYARGFALNGTHYASIPANVERARAIRKVLAAKGYPDRRVVINTSNNGHPFNFVEYTGSDPTNPVVCDSSTTPAKVTCETLGIPPTSDVANDRWHLPTDTARLAAKFVDAYLWFGRPWLHHEGSQPFVTKRAIKLVKTTPYR
jgi:endoglucanase